MKITKNRTQKGFTLVELLVGMALGIFLTGAVIQSYLATKATSRVTDSINRIQENSRFAYHLLTRDLRETSSLGCMRSIRDMSQSTSQFTDLRVKVGGWDHDNTSAGDNVDLSNVYAVSTSRGDWSGISVGTNDDLPSNIDSIASSDVILIKKVTHLSSAVVTQTADAGLASINITNYTPSENETLIVGDCQRADVFVVDTVSTTDLVSEVTAKGTFNFGKNWGDSAFVYSVSYLSYYIGYRPGADTPSLYRKDFASGAQAQELVEGVENMQLLYGVDLNSDGYANRYVSASSISNWTNIVSVRAGFIYVSPGAKEPQAAAAEEVYKVVDAINFKAAANDNDLRYVSNITVKTRNLGLSQDFDVCFVADTSPENATCDKNGYVLRTPPLN